MSVLRRAMVIVVVLCGVAAAAPSGGSIGGGSWGGRARGGGGWSGGGTGVGYSVGYGVHSVPTQPASGDWRNIALLALGLAVIAAVVMAPRRPRVWTGTPREAHVAELHVAFAPAARTALTSLVVEHRLPDLTKLPGAIAGPHPCVYCGARYPIEDATCPRCGAHPRVMS